jgi:hypothetical protein
MKKLVCEFSGWFEISIDNVKLTNPNADDDAEYTKTAAEWLEEKGDIEGLILESFSEAVTTATEGEFMVLILSIEES